MTRPNIERPADGPDPSALTDVVDTTDNLRYRPNQAAPEAARGRRLHAQSDLT